jgi:hypothetical protein
MSRSRALSFRAAAVNVLAGCGIALAMQFAVQPLVWVDMRTRRTMAIGAVLSFATLIRSNAPRRLFDRLASRRA